MYHEDISEDELADMTVDELEAWADANSIGPWEPNTDVPRTPHVSKTSITLRIQPDLLAEIKDEASARYQPYQRYMRELLLLGLRHVQALPRRPVSPVHVVLNDEQLSELTEHGQLTVRLHRPAR
jgi:predicted DNA binding CopG/RHH family protein